MNRPTPKEMATSRALVERMAKALEEGRTTSLMPGVEASALRTLLAVATPPTDEEILAVFEQQQGTWGDITIKTLRAFIGYPITSEPSEERP